MGAWSSGHFPSHQRKAPPPFLFFIIFLPKMKSRL
jgi:hypothetical protein